MEYIRDPKFSGILIALGIGLVAGIVSIIATKAKHKGPENPNIVRPFLLSFTFFFSLTYIVLYFSRPSSKPDLETVMRHVHGGDPGF
jgi:hypothetical protein